MMEGGHCDFAKRGELNSSRAHSNALSANQMHSWCVNNSVVCCSLHLILNCNKDDLVDFGGFARKAVSSANLGDSFEVGPQQRE